MVIPVDILRSAFVQIWDLPGFLSDDPVVEDEDCGDDRSEDCFDVREWLGERE